MELCTGKSKFELTFIPSVLKTEAIAIAIAVGQLTCCGLYSSKSSRTIQGRYLSPSLSPPPPSPLRRVIGCLVIHRVVWGQGGGGIEKRGCLREGEGLINVFQSFKSVVIRKTHFHSYCFNNEKEKERKKYV